MNSDSGLRTSLEFITRVILKIKRQTIVGNRW
jgi:hypothetical protein